MPVTGLRPHDLAHPTPDRAARDARDLRSDDELIEGAAARLAVPRAAPADSFVLHAPLELLARAALLPGVDPSRRDEARHRIDSLADGFDAAGPAVARPPDPDKSGVPSDAEIAAIVDAGDLDAIDRAAQALAMATSADELATRLTDLVLPRLAAAAHGAIFLYHLPRRMPSSPAAATMVRGLLREIGRRPEWRLTWMDDRSADHARRDDLLEVLLAPPSPGDPGSPFIHPMMSLVERSGLARRLLDGPTRGVSVAAARRRLLRVAAWSMLQDEADHAPYGWSHALTMPQATLGIAHRSQDPGRAIAVASTYALGFRSILGSTRLDPDWTPTAPPTTEVDEFLDHGPASAAAAMWHAPEAQYPQLVRAVVTAAATHHDAHLVKYTLACIDATRDDPDAGRLFMAAAAFLAGWWRAH